MELDRVERDEQLGGDVLVLAPRGGKLGHAALAAGQGARASGPPAPRARSGGAQLGEDLLLERARAAAMREVERLAQRVARADTVAVLPERGAERGESPCPLEQRGAA